jgi:hypothetical protein
LLREFLGRGFLPIKFNACTMLKHITMIRFATSAIQTVA